MIQAAGQVFMPLALPRLPRKPARPLYWGPTGLSRHLTNPRSVRGACRCFLGRSSREAESVRDRRVVAPGELEAATESLHSFTSAPLRVAQPARRSLAAFDVFAAGAFAGTVHLAEIAGPFSVHSSAARVRGLRVTEYIRAVTEEIAMTRRNTATRSSPTINPRSGGLAGAESA